MATAEFKKFIQFSKLEDSADDKGATVWGIATWEQPDSDNESCSYETAKPVYQAWSAKAFKRTKNAGQEVSLGNLRLQHGSEVGGKATKLHYDDAAKEIWLGSEPINDEIHQALKKGFYTGYSQGGSYAWRECSVCDSTMPMQQGANFCENCGKNVMVRYGLRRIAEVSYVDSPATGEGFEHVKANGSTEIVKFAKKKTEVPPVAKTTETVKRDAAVITARKAKATEMLKARIDTAAATKGLQKGLYMVGRFADLLESLASMYEYSVYEREIEGDDSEVPDELKEQLDAMIETFIAMAEEEAKELSAKKTETGAENMTPEELELLQKAAKKSLASHFAKASSHHAKLADMHEAMADHHEGLAAAHGAAVEDCKECMGKSDAAKAAKLAKADLGEEGAEGDDGIHQVLSNQVTFHKASEKEHKGLAKKHDGMAKAHDKFAEHLDKCAKSEDMEEAEKTVKAIAEFDAANPEPEAVVKGDEKPKVITMEDDVIKAVAAARETPAYKEQVAKMAEEYLQAEIQKKREAMILPTEARVSGTILDGTTAKTIVARSDNKEESVLASRTRKGDFGGL